MSKHTAAGIDVSKDVLDVAAQCDGKDMDTARFDNDAAGHGTLAYLSRNCGRGELGQCLD